MTPPPQITTRTRRSRQTPSRARRCIGAKLTYHCGNGNPGRPQERRGRRSPTVPKARVRIHVENNAETEALRFTPAHLERILAAHPGLRERLAVTINDDPDRTDGQSDAEILFAV